VDEPFVRPESIPELQTIMQLGLTSKVRVFDGRCEDGDLLFQVVKVHKRPLALARCAIVTSTASPNPAFRRPTHTAHRAVWNAMWLDLDPLAYYQQHEPSELGELGIRVLMPYRLSAECKHQRLSVPGDWLREQLEKGVTKRIIDNATRFEIGTWPRGE
jgi:hypothetical protein